MLCTRLWVYFLHHLSAFVAYMTYVFTFLFELTHVSSHYADRMLGQGKLAELRALARAHGLASGSQTVPNSVVEMPLHRADRHPKAQLIPRPSPPISAKSLSSGNQRGRPLKWFMRKKKKTMRRLKMASSPRRRGWRLLHPLLHLLLQHQHHLPHQLHLQHCFLPQLPPRQSKRFLWRPHFLWLRPPSLTSWRIPRAPPRLMYQLEGVLLHTSQLQTLH